MNKFNKIAIVMLACLFFIPNILPADENVSPEGFALTLDKTVETALANNTLIREAIEKQKAAVEEKNSAKADFFPKYVLL